MAFRGFFAAILALQLAAAPVEGVVITEVPPEEMGVLVLRERVLLPGDVLTAQQAEQVEFRPGCTAEALPVTAEYLPITGDGVGDAAVVTFRTHKNQPPQARDGTLETYKNLPNTGRLPVSDPEGQAMTYTLVRQPRRGTVAIASDGRFTYTPEENKVGIDSFVYTATDESGAVSQEATVTVTILKPTDSALYTDTLGENCRFEAEWMKNTGIFRGESLAGQDCFQPGKAVTQGEFLVMLLKTLDIPVEEKLELAGFADAPAWLRPYLAAALRAGITGIRPEQIITEAEAAAMVETVLGAAPAFAPADGPMTRGTAAEYLYRVYKASV